MPGLHVRKVALGRKGIASVEYAILAASLLIGLSAAFIPVRNALDSLFSTTIPALVTPAASEN
jgi:Flp pilus assembly pilin Flp